MEQRISRLNNYFDRQIAFCQQRRQELLADDRADEAVFEKIQANVYDIFRTVLGATAKACRNDPDKTKQDFLVKVQQISLNWRTAYEKAQQHDDAVQMKIEQIKLDATHEIEKAFTNIWEGKA